ncbi:hypothetical protein ES708_15223 [subsurface metagenome]
MKVTDVIPEEKMMVFYEATLEIIKAHLKEDVAVGATKSLLKNRDRVDEKTKSAHTFCDGYHRGMAVVMALIEAGIINIQTVELKRTL